MGLDMYLSKKHYVQNWEHNGPEGQHEIAIKKGGKTHPYINTSKITYITEQLGYWRKANAIHAWFVEHCQDGEDNCKEYNVSREQLQELLDACILVRDNSKLVNGKVNNGYTFENGKEKPIVEKGKIIEDSSVAQDLLPSQRGFFFGGTDYDEYYMQDILDTIEMLEAELSIKYEDGFYEPKYTYRASW